MDQLPRLGKRELICLLLFTCNYVVLVWRGFLFLWVLWMGYVILLWHSLSLTYNYFVRCLLYLPIRYQYECRPGKGLTVILNGSAKIETLHIIKESAIVSLVKTGLALSTILVPRRGKTCLLGFRLCPSQTGQYNHRRWLEA